jgi:hypothetical protein
MGIAVDPLEDNPPLIVDSNGVERLQVALSKMT